MSSHCMRRVGAALPKRLTNHSPFFTRLQSTKKGSSGRSLLLYGGTAINAAIVGSVVYANHNPRFKHVADSYVPGFAYLVDQSAAFWGTGQTVLREWWKRIKGIVVSDEEQQQARAEEKNKYDDHVQQAIKRRMEETATRQAESKKAETTTPSATTTDPDTNKSRQSSSTQDAKPTASTGTEKHSSKSASGDRGEKEKPPVAVDKAPSKSPQKESKDKHAPTESSVASASGGKGVSAVKTTASAGSTSASSDTLKSSSVSDTSTSTSPAAKGMSTSPDANPTTAGTGNRADTSSADESTGVGPDQTVPSPDKLPPPSSKPDETVLMKAYQQFTKESETLLASQQQLVQAITAHHLQLLEASEPSTSDEQERVSAGSVGGTEQALQEARKEVEKARTKQKEATDHLESAITTTNDTAAVRQVQEKKVNYLKKIEKADKEIAEEEDRQRRVAAKIQQRSKEERTEAQSLESTDQSDQEALLAMMQSSLNEQLEKEIQSRVEEALKNQRKLFDEELKEVTERVVEEKAKQFGEILARKEEEMENSYEQKLKDELLVQSKAHRYHLHETLEQQADELSQQWSEELSTKLRDVEEAHLQEMVAALSELKGVQSTISTVVETDEATRTQQSVRTACDALTRAIMAANSNPDPLRKHNISSQVSVLLQTAQEDRFITTILVAIPEEAVVEGISSETGLKARFKHVRKVCQRVAFVPEEGAGLGTYLLSFLQSLLTIDMAHSRMVNSADMNTFDILQEADACIDQGQLEKAVRLMNQLQGEPRRVARDWLREARLYLATRQAVTVVAEYLAASSISVLK